MGNGCPNGRGRGVALGVGLFVDEDGYTSVAVATALLASVSLMFCVATVEWTLSRSADVQEVADAAALAGSNVVASYHTVAQVIDASVLSMGLAGVTVMGAGLVVSAIPGAQSFSKEVLQKGAQILDARNGFARSAVSGLQKVETMLPGLIAASSWSCVRANADDGAQYFGVAVPFPMDSLSDYASLSTELETDAVPDEAERLQEATRQVEESKRRADDSRLRAWTADCVDAPRCLRSRAESLAGLAASQNPYAPSPESWTFGMAIQRSRSYYAQRLARETPASQDIGEVTNSLCRAAFYEYALGEVNAAWYMEGTDGSVDLYLPHLARNASEMRETWLYDNVAWPCTQEGESVRLHSSLSCPGATGPHVGYQSVASLEYGVAERCDVCRMDVGDLGAVANISTSANNGYEHYWQIIVEESQAYRQARNEQAEAERQAREIAEDGKGAFERVLDQLRVPRPQICPPGAWGCVGIVRRSRGTTAPSRLTAAFLGDVELPAGVAVSASALAVDNDSGDAGVLTHFFDTLAGEDGFGMGSLLGGITGLWGRMLVSYGSAYEGVGDAAGSFLDRIDGVFGGTVGAWLSGKVGALMGSLGLEPADMRMRKPVLVHTSEVLGMAGIEPTGAVRSLVQALPDGGSALDMAHALGVQVGDGGLGGSVTIADLPIPGTGISIPLRLDLVGMGGGGL